MSESSPVPKQVDSKDEAQSKNSSAMSKSRRCFMSAASTCLDLGSFQNLPDKLARHFLLQDTPPPRLRFKIQTREDLPVSRTSSPDIHAHSQNIRPV